jgi:23S rRNA (pseudouridine1915-N3)-methyltransferase
MKIKIYSVNKTKEDHTISHESEYLKRIKGYCNVDIIEISPKIKAVSPEEIKLAEGNAILELIEPSDFLIALDERGKNLASVEFSKYLSDKMTQGKSTFSFVIGGAYGLHESVRKRANLLLSLSNMTFPHQMARLILIEQVYRAFSIMRGEPYHKA